MTAPDRILVVEDTDTDRLLARRRLTKRWPDVDITFTADGQEALSHLDGDDDAPDLILLDVSMPRMGGHEFLTALADRPALAHIPVVILSASARDRDLTRAASSPSVHGYLLKPLGADGLVDGGAPVRRRGGTWRAPPERTTRTDAPRTARSPLAGERIHIESWTLPATTNRGRPLEWSGRPPDRRVASSPGRKKAPRGGLRSPPGVARG